MSRPLPKGLWPAVTNVERVGFARLLLYRHYDNDERLRDGLDLLHSKWWTELGTRSAGSTIASQIRMPWRC